MNEVTVNNNDGKIMIALSGHIDSANAAEVEAEVRKGLGEPLPAEVVFDAENLKYISSAGLRILLRLRKETENVRVTNVSNEIYEILDMTGFTEMITVEKAYRSLSIEGCEVIGQGANGKVYRIDRDTIVKVYYDSDALDDIKRERELARHAFVLGIPTAIPYDVVKVGDSYGSVYELLNAETFASIIARDPERTDEMIGMAIDLLKKIHSTEVKPGDMPQIKETAVGWAAYLEPYLPAEVFQKLQTMMQEIPDSDHMLHGDYHFKNLMLQDGEVLLIDMDTICVGHPIFEFAAIFGALRGFAVVDHSNCKSFLGLDYDKCGEILDKMVHCYFPDYNEDQIADLLKKASIISFTRIMRRTIKRSGMEEGKELIEACYKKLVEMVPEVDKLYF